MDVAALADVAKDADTVFVAQLEVPTSVPVCDPTKEPLKDPELIWADADTSVGLLSRVLKSAADALAA